jgi:hypothetical protein
MPKLLSLIARFVIEDMRVKSSEEKLDSVAYRDHMEERKYALV